MIAQQRRKDLDESFIQQQFARVERHHQLHSRPEDYYKYSPEIHPLKLGILFETTRIALESFQNGTYGICVDCGEDIPVERLRLIPGAIRCVGCQEEFEHGLETS